MCQHIYDVMGCDWNMPANYSEGVFEECLGDSAQVRRRFFWFMQITGLNVCEAYGRLWDIYVLPRGA